MLLDIVLGLIGTILVLIIYGMVTTYLKFSKLRNAALDAGRTALDKVNAEVNRQIQKQKDDERKAEGKLTDSEVEDVLDELLADDEPK